jgi:hypothetical protein
MFGALGKGTRAKQIVEEWIKNETENKQIIE